MIPADIAEESLTLDLLDQFVRVDPADDLPLHAQLRRGLRSIIETHCSDGQKFFTEPQLIQHLRVSQSTVRRALLDLTRDGLLQRKVAKGSFVQKPAPGAREVFTLRVFMPEWKSAFLMAVLECLSNECRNRNLRMEVEYTHRDDSVELIRRPVERTPQQEGIILFSIEPEKCEALRTALVEKDYRVVVVDSLTRGVRSACVNTSNEEIVRLGFDHLAEFGHRRIVFLINEPEDHPNVVERTAVFERQAAARGLDEAAVFHCGTHFFEDSFDAAYGKMAEMMEQHRPTAIFAMSDPGAWAALRWLGEQGIAVPGEVSVLGFSDDSPSRFTNPPLSTIAHPYEEIARSAVDLIMREKFTPEKRFLSPALVVRGRYREGALENDARAAG